MNAKPMRATPAGDESYHLIEMHPGITLRDIAAKRSVTLPAAHIAIRRLIAQNLVHETCVRVPGKGSKLERRYWTAEAFQGETGVDG